MPDDGPKVLVYEPSVAEDPEEDKHHHQPEVSLPPVHNNRSLVTSSPRPPPSWERKPRSDSTTEGWEVVRHGSVRGGRGGGAVTEVGPPRKLDVPDTAV